MDATTLPSKVDAGAQAKRAVLLVTSGPRSGLLIDLSRGTKLTLGRAPECDEAFDDPELSRRHAEVGVAPGGHFVRDLESRNGVFLNGEPISMAATLTPNDHIRLGTQLHMRFVVFEQREVDEWRALSRATEVVRSRIVQGSPEVAERTSARMRQLVDQARRAAQSDLPILLLGETGVGKDVMARAIHAASPRATKPYVAVNCGALAGGILEAELFGSERGAYTGAERAREGLIAAADGGTLFLDEIGELPLAGQVKLLRVLEDRQVTRLGSEKPRRIDVRFVAATNRSLEEEVKAGRFRSDLLFRVNAISLAIPPLRERREEIRGLATTFVREIAQRMGRPVPVLSEAAMAALEARPYPGNVRELRNLVESAVVMSERSEIGPADLMLAPAAPSIPAERPAALEDELRAVERVRILAALEACGGNQSRAAEQLGMPRRTLVKRLGEWGLTRRRES